MALTDRFRDALALAFDLHRGQVRKGTRIPYVSHLLGVCDLVLFDGGDEHEAIAALLHDAAEDQGGREVLERIRERFGKRVAGIVEACSDALVPKGAEKPPWRTRKEAYLARLPEHPEAWRVSLADKLNNARAVLADLRRADDREQVWNRFNGKKDGTLWYYRAMADFFGEGRRGWMAEELDRTVGELEALAEERAARTITGNG
ncbi:MAG TPA: HD domain-containing protein [Actinomycetota bacterium]|nr:HD domain-containing protein [Actinomycetota bacterium]